MTQDKTSSTAALKLQNRQGLLPNWCVAFGINFLLALIVIGPILLKNNGFLAMSHDFSAQEIAFNISANRALKSGEFLWNWGLDLGGNLLEVFSFYNLGSIFFWISLLFPAKWSPLVMPWMMMLKIAVAGATSASYIQRHVKSRPVVWMSSVLYAFCGFQCMSIVFYHFQDPIALFPLLLIGLEELVEEGKRGRLVAACVLNVLCNYVFFVGEVLFLAVFYLVRYLLPGLKARSGEWFRSLLNCAVEGILGMMIAGVLLIPAIAGTLANSRVSEHLPVSEWLTMSTQDWLMLIKAFLFPADIMNEMTSVYRANWMSNSAYLPMIGVVLAVAYAISKKDWISQMLKISAVFVIVPILNNMFMFFSVEDYRRWYYMLILIMVVATAKVVEKPQKFKIVPAAIGCAAVWLLYLVLTTMTGWDGDNTLVFKPEQFRFLAIVSALGFLLTIVLVLTRIKHYRQIMLAGVAGFSVVCLSFVIGGYQNTQDNTNIDFRTFSNSYGENVVNYLTEIPSQMQADVLPYRYYFDEGIGHTYYNMALTNLLPSINSFCSTMHPSINEFYDSIGVGRATWTNRAEKGVNELLGARYVVSNVEHPEYIPVGDGVLENSNGQSMYVYENPDALPLGYTYQSYITQSEFEQYPRELRGIVMLNTLVVPDEEEARVSQRLEHCTQEITEADYRQGIDSRKQEQSEEFQVENNYFRSTITAQQDCYAFFAVPYDKNWKVTVNGEEVSVLKVNGLMAVEIDQGQNVIEFNYTYKPLTIGIACSLMGIVGCAGYLAVTARWKREKNPSKK